MVSLSSAQTAALARTPRRAKKVNDPEHQLQCQVAGFLAYALPSEILWTANAAGVRVSMGVAKKMKAAGVRRGFPDLQFVLPDGRTHYIELKAKAGLSGEQKAFRDTARAHGIWGLARSLEQVVALLDGWNIHLRARPQ